MIQRFAGFLLSKFLGSKVGKISTILTILTPIGVSKGVSKIRLFFSQKGVVKNNLAPEFSGAFFIGFSVCSKRLNEFCVWCSTKNMYARICFPTEVPQYNTAAKLSVLSGQAYQ